MSLNPDGLKLGLKIKDRVGHVFGKLTIIKFAKKTPDNSYIWLCKCDCGNEKAVAINNLRNGTVSSCGCKKKVLTHGCSRNPKTRPEYRVLERMIRRCTEQGTHHWKNYGGRGIAVCKEWDNPSKFLAFYNHVGPRPTPQHTIERIDNNKGYEPGNVRWATRPEQQRNRRNNVWIAYNGETLCRKDAANKYGIPDWTLKKRLKCGWSVKDALTLPVGSVKRYKK